MQEIKQYGHIINTDVEFTTSATFSTCKTQFTDLFKQNNSANFQTESIKSSLWDYFDAFLLVTGDITATADNIKDITFRNCALFFTFQGEKSIQSSLWDYFTTFNLVTGDITVIAHNKSRCCIYKLPIIFNM